MITNDQVNMKNKWNFQECKAVVLMVKNLPAVQETQVQSLERGIATHSNILAWRIPWTEEPGGLQSMGLQRVGHDWASNTFSGLV